MKEIFRLSDAGDSGALHVRPSSTFPNHIQVFRGETEANEPIVFHLSDENGSEQFDLIGSELVSIKLVSREFVQVLKTAGLSGWSTVPAKVLDRFGNAMGEYSILVVSGRSGDLRYGKNSDGEVVFRLDKGDYASDDFSLAGDWNTILVSERAKEVLEQEQLTNLTFDQLNGLVVPWPVSDD